MHSTMEIKVDGNPEDTRKLFRHLTSLIRPAVAGFGGGKVAIDHLEIDEDVVIEKAVSSA